MLGRQAGLCVLLCLPHITLGRQAGLVCTPGSFHTLYLEGRRGNYFYSWGLGMLETKSSFVAQAGLKLSVLLLWSECLAFSLKSVITQLGLWRLSMAGSRAVL